MSFLNKDLFLLDGVNQKVADLVNRFTSPIDIIKNYKDELLSHLNGQVIEGTVEDGAEIIGDVFIGAGSIIHAGAVIQGPVYIGKNCSIRPHANIRHDTYLCDNVIAGHSADINKSLIMNGAKVQDGTYAGESLLGKAARVGSGAIMANRKFNQTPIRVDLGQGYEDTGMEYLGCIMGDQSRLGANVVTSPGSIVGMHTWIGSGVVVHGSIPSNKLVTVKQELDIREKEPVELGKGR